MNNPFRYGIPVDEPNFINREQEITGVSVCANVPRRHLISPHCCLLPPLGEIHNRGNCAGNKLCFHDFL